MKDAVLLVGWRPEAARTARERGFEVLLLELGEAPARRRRAVHRGLVLPTRVLASRNLGSPLEDLARGYKVHAVQALTEISVETAARARRHFGLKGIGGLTAHRCRDKFTMKTCIRAAGLACADACRVEAQTRADDLIERLGLPLVLKQRAASGGRGTVVARCCAEVDAAIAPRRMAEAFVEGVERSVESFVLGGEVLFSNVTEYLVPGVANIVPAVLSESDLGHALELNRRAIAGLGFERGITHLELFLQPERAVFGEIAARPPGGRIMKLIEQAYGFDPWRALLQVELGETPELRAAPRSWAGAWFLHPGNGTLLPIEGYEEARAVAGVDRLELRVKEGHVIRPRLGTGVHVGCIEATGSTRDAVARSLREASRLLRLRVVPC
jgi:biotin carboxylase